MATITAIHTPAAISIHWREKVKEHLDADVALGVIGKVEPNVPTTWCHHAIWVRKLDGISVSVLEEHRHFLTFITESYHLSLHLRNILQVVTNTHIDRTKSSQTLHEKTNVLMILPSGMK